MSSPEEIEEKIKEQRVLEATKKGLMGQNGKIAIVLKIYGEPIIGQKEGGTFVDSYYINLENNDIKSLDEINNSEDLLRNIPIMNLEDNIRPQSEEWMGDMPDGNYYSVETVGVHFDGLRRGMHMEINYNYDLSEMSLYYKGYIVYKEIKGELISYAPYEEWEKWIESLYKSAKEKLRKIKEEEFEESIKISEKEKNFWWQKIKEKWGIK
jgi:hypothetical protein